MPAHSLAFAGRTELSQSLFLIDGRLPKTRRSVASRSNRSA